MVLSVRVVGVGDAFTARYFNACLLVECDDTRLLVDAPPALARALGAMAERGVGEPAIGLDDVDHVLITHLHGDHCGGLEQLLFWRRFVTGRRCHLYAIPAVLADLWSTRLKGGMDTLMDAHGARTTLALSDYAEVHPLDAVATHVGPLRVEWRPTIHHIPTSALRVSAAGRTLGYSADTAFDPALVEWLAESDLFFHETNVGVHTPLASLEALAPSVRERMRLIHYPDYHDVDSSPIACAREGDRFVV
jgi:ribonuclease BN (tRNA processing enzyme)